MRLIQSCLQFSDHILRTAGTRVPMRRVSDPCGLLAESMEPAPCTRRTRDQAQMREDPHDHDRLYDRGEDLQVTGTIPVALMSLESKRAGYRSRRPALGKYRH